MGFLGGEAHASIHVEKPDLLSITATAAPGTLNGCKWCQKTILFNGGTWVHINDRPDCAYIKCSMEWIEGKTEAAEVPSFFGGKMRQVPVGRCVRCSAEHTAWFSAYSKAWQLTGSSSCPAAVATPARPVDGGAA